MLFCSSSNDGGDKRKHVMRGDCSGQYVARMKVIYTASSALVLCLLAVHCLAHTAPQYPSAPSGRILHLTDLHYDTHYQAGAPANCFERKQFGIPCCHEFSKPISPERNASAWGDYNCDTPFVLLNETLYQTAQFLKKAGPIDMILWTGDDPGHHVVTQLPWENLNAIALITDLIKDYFPDVPVFPSLGNHDTWPTDQLDPKHAAWLFEPVAGNWSYWLPEEEQQSTMRKGGYYTVLIRPGFRLISLNSLLYENNNIWLNTSNIVNDDPLGQWKWLTDTLATARASNEKVWIISHVNPGNGEMAPGFTGPYLKLLQEYAPDTVTAQFYGHTHKDEFQVMPDVQSTVSKAPGGSGSIRINNGEDAAGTLLDGYTPLQAIYVAPSIMPDQSNPAFRLYEYNPTATQVNDWVAYYADLNDIIATDKVEFDFYYRASETFGIPDVSGSSLFTAIQEMAKNATYFDEYNARKFSNVPGHDCTGDCRQKTLCEMLWVTRENIEDCKKSSWLV